MQRLCIQFGELDINWPTSHVETYANKMHPQSSIPCTVSRIVYLHAQITVDADNMYESWLVWSEPYNKSLIFITGKTWILPIGAYETRENWRQFLYLSLVKICESVSDYHWPDQLCSHWGARQSATPDSEKIAKNREKEGKIRKKEEKLGRKGKNREGSCTLPLLTDRAGYATGPYPQLEP